MTNNQEIFVKMRIPWAKIFLSFNFVINFIKNFYAYKSKFLNVFSDIKVNKYPLWLQYSPQGYMVKGQQTLEIMKIIKPGDILGRNYVDYLDNKFIPGNYKHSGIYVGNNKVIHAIAEGVSEINLIDFLRCDGICVLRPKKGSRNAIRRAKQWLGKPFDFDFVSGNDKFYCHELLGKAYEEFNIQKYYPELFGVKIIFVQKKYQFDSFLTNENFEKIYEYDPQKEDMVKGAIQSITSLIMLKKGK